jgi:hypothetical protein
MTATEIKLLVADIVDRWPHSKLAVAQYLSDLEPVRAEHAVAALDSLYRDGERFAPSGAQIIGRIADLALDVPAWGSVVGELHRRQTAAGKQSWTKDRTCPLGRCDGRGLVIDDEARTSRYCECRDKMQAEIAARQTTHPVVASFLAEVGQRELVDVLAGDRTAEAQVRTKYEAYVRGVRRSVVYTGIDTAGLPALERLQREAAVRMGQLPPPAPPQGLRVVEGGLAEKRGLWPVADVTRDLAGGVA